MSGGRPQQRIDAAFLPIAEPPAVAPAAVRALRDAAVAIHTLRDARHGGGAFAMNEVGLRMRSLSRDLVLRLQQSRLSDYAALESVIAALEVER